MRKLVTNGDMSMRFLQSLVLAAMIVAPGVVLAQGNGQGNGQGGGQGGGQVRAACQNDIRAMCGSVQPGGGRIRDCMRQHRAELSAACKVAIADRMLERGGQRANNGAGITTVPGK
jgi:hypothetical protein